MLRNVFILAAIMTGSTATYAGAIVASYSDDLQPITPAPGWSYLWNSDGPIGYVENYTSLLATTDAESFYDTDGIDGIPGSGPGDYLYIGKVGDFGWNPELAGTAGGHPGKGANDPASEGIERFAIAAYTVAKTGSYNVQNSALFDAAQSSDGVNVKVYANDSATPVISAATTAFNDPVPFDAELGLMQAGDTIYVAVGSGATDLRDAFALRYEIIMVPEPSSIALLSVGLMALAFPRRKASIM